MDTAPDDTPGRIIAHTWSRLPRSSGWKLVIIADNGTAGTLTIRWTGGHARIHTDTGAKQLMHLIPAGEIERRLRPR